jgi:DHA1 family bicyclomycin/chloramphenicol resistance-like MFS transporter
MHPREFVAFVAAIMAVNALGVDLMLPALADIGRDLAVGDANHRQWIITVYMVGSARGNWSMVRWRTGSAAGQSSSAH